MRFIEPLNAAPLTPSSSGLLLRAQYLSATNFAMAAVPFAP